MCIDINNFKIYLTYSKFQTSKFVPQNFRQMNVTFVKEVELNFVDIFENRGIIN